MTPIDTMDTPVTEPVKLETADYISLEKELAYESPVKTSTALLPRLGQVDDTLAERAMRKTLAGSIVKMPRVANYFLDSQADYVEGYITQKEFHQIIGQISPDLEKARKILDNVYALTVNYNLNF